METTEITTKQQHYDQIQILDYTPKISSQEESYESLVDSIRVLYNGNISDVEAHAAARRFIEFVKILLRHYEKIS